MRCTALHSTGLQCTCTALHSTGLQCAALHCTGLQCTCTALHSTGLHCTALHMTAHDCTRLQCAALLRKASHCTALHCTGLHCTAPLAPPTHWPPLPPTPPSCAHQHTQVQLFFRRPPEAAKLLGSVLAQGVKDAHQDVHDQALAYYRWVGACVCVCVCVCARVCVSA